MIRAHYQMYMGKDILKNPFLFGKETKYSKETKILGIIQKQERTGNAYKDKVLHTAVM